MSDLETLQEMFTRRKVYFEMKDPHRYGPAVKVDSSEVYEMEVPANAPIASKFVNEGYGGFQAGMCFDAEGNLLSFGVWE